MDTLVDRLNGRITKPAEGSLIDVIARECTIADEVAEMEDALRVWAEADAR